MNCPYCKIEGVMYRMILSSGAIVVTQRCPKCGISTGEKLFFPKKDIPDIDKLPLYADNTIHSEPCAVKDCKNKGTEYHHWAPRHLFENADDWPFSYLCREHHILWHKMTKTGTYRPQESRHGKNGKHIAVR
jgi:hypothetical protein